MGGCVSTERDEKSDAVMLPDPNPQPQSLYTPAQRAAIAARLEVQAARAPITIVDFQPTTTSQPKKAKAAAVKKPKAEEPKAEEPKAAPAPAPAPVEPEISEEERVDFQKKCGIVESLLHDGEDAAALSVIEVLHFKVDPSVLPHLFNVAVDNNCGDSAHEFLHISLEYRIKTLAITEKYVSMCLSKPEGPVHIRLAEVYWSQDPEKIQALQGLDKLTSIFLYEGIKTKRQKMMVHKLLMRRFKRNVSFPEKILDQMEGLYRPYLLSAIVKSGIHKRMSWQMQTPKRVAHVLWFTDYNDADFDANKKVWRKDIDIWKELWKLIVQVHPGVHVGAYLKVPFYEHTRSEWRADENWAKLWRPNAPSAAVALRHGFPRLMQWKFRGFMQSKELPEDLERELRSLHKSIKSCPELYGDLLKLLWRWYKKKGFLKSACLQFVLKHDTHPDMSYDLLYDERRPEILKKVEQPHPRWDYGDWDLRVILAGGTAIIPILQKTADDYQWGSIKSKVRSHWRWPVLMTPKQYKEINIIMMDPHRVYLNIPIHEYADFMKLKVYNGEHPLFAWTKDWNWDLWKSVEGMATDEQLSQLTSNIKEGCPLVVYMAMNGHDRHLAQLLMRGPNACKKDQAWANMSATKWATIKDHHECVRLLQDVDDGSEPA